MHQSGTQNNHAGTLLNAQDASHAGGGNFTHAMAHNSRRGHAHGLPQGAQGHLHGKNSGLADFCLLKAGIRFAATQLFQQIKPCVRLHGFGTSFHRCTKDRLMGHQFAPHAPPLGALATHDKSDAWRVLAARTER